MYSAYKLNKQGDNIQPWRTPFPIWNQSVVPCPVLTVASWPAYRFLKSQVRWSGIPISFRIFHCLWWSTQSKASIIFHYLLEFAQSICSWSRSRCFFWNSLTFSMIQYVGNLIPGSSAFSQPSLYIWRLSLYILLKPNSKDFEHYHASMWNEHGCGSLNIFPLPIFGIGMKTATLCI